MAQGASSVLRLAKLTPDRRSIMGGDRTSGNIDIELTRSHMPEPTDEIESLKQELVKLQRASKRSRQDRGTIQLMLAAGSITLFALGFKLDASADGVKYSWNVDSSAIISLLSGSGAIASGAMAAKNLLGADDKDDDAPSTQKSLPP